MDDGGAPAEEPDFKHIPLQDRCVDKNWKARVDAYTELIQKFSKTSGDDDHFFRPYLNQPDLIRAWAVDSNAAAQEKGLEAIGSLIANSGENAARTRETVMPAVVDKGFLSVRAGTKQKAIEVAMLYVEVESGPAVIADVMKGLDAKQPKLVATTVACLRDLVNAFGIKPLDDPKTFIKALVKIFNHNDKTVRAEGTTLAQALYRYLGPALMPALGDLKPVQQKELEAGFAVLDEKVQGAGSGKPIRFTRKEARAQAERENSGAPADTANDEPSVIEEVDLREIVDIVPRFPSNFHEVMASKVWKEKFELVTECNKILEDKQLIVKDVPALGDIASVLAAKMSDVNVNVVSACAGMITLLAEKVEDKAFGKYKGALMPAILARLKEKKTVDSLGRALDALFETVSFSEITGDCTTALQDKNPAARQGTLQFLARSLRTTKQAPTKSDLDVIAPAIVGQLGDSLEPVRSAAAEGLGALSKIFGERPMNPYLENITDAQRTKINEAMATSVVQCKAGGAPPPPKPAPAAAAPKAKMPARLAARLVTKPAEDAPEDEAPKPKAATPVEAAAPRVPSSASVSTHDFGSDIAAPTPVKKAGPPARLTARAPPPAAKKPAVAAPKPAANKSGAAKSPPSELNVFAYRYSPEDAEAKAAEVVPPEIQAGLASAQWKERLEAAGGLKQWLSSDPAGVVEGNQWFDVAGGFGVMESEILFRYLGKVPGWNEKNFQVSTQVYEIMTLIARESPSFGKSSAAQVIGPLTDKLGDIKLKKSAGEALTTFAEKTSLGFVLSQGFETMTKQKSPKVQGDALLWVNQALLDFGAKKLPLPEVINFLKVGLSSSNGAVRSNATAVLVTLKLFVQADLSSFLEDLNPTLLNTINGEFEKIAGKAAPEPLRESADLAGLDEAGGSGAADDQLDELIPRVDLNKIVAGTTVLKDSKSENWRVRKEAFEALEGELERNKRLKPEMGEIAHALKQRMDDNNLAVKLLCLRIIAKIADGMGAPFQTHARLFAGPIANICGDQKQPTRNAAVETLNAIAENCSGIDTMVPGLAASIEKPNPVLRGCVLAFIASVFVRFPPKADLAPLVTSTLASLEDRNGDVRKAAQAVLPFILQSVGYDSVMSQVAKLKPASKSTVTPLVQAAWGSVAATPSASDSKSVSKSAEAKPVGTRLVNKPVLGESNSIPETMAARSVSATSVSNTATPPRLKAEPIKARGMQMKNNALRAPGAASTDALDHRLPAPSRSTMGLSGGLPRPAARRPLPMAETPAPEARLAAPFHTVDAAPKLQREKRDLARWIYDASNSTGLVEYLQKQMVDHASSEILTLLFSRDRFAEKDHAAGLAIIDQLYSGGGDDTPFDLSAEIAQKIRFANMDLALKYAGIRVHDGSTQMVLKCLDLIQHIVEGMDRARAGFSEAESNVILPALIYRLGDNKYKDKLTAIFGLVDRTMPSSRVMQLYVDYGVSSSNSKTRAAAMEQLAQLIRRRGNVAASATNPTKTYRRIAEFISSADSATRNAALDCIAYMCRHESNVLNMIGELPPKERDLLNNRIDKLGNAGPINTPPRSSTSASTHSGLANGSTAGVRGDEGGSSAGGSPVPNRRLSSRPSVGGKGSVSPNIGRPVSDSNDNATTMSARNPQAEAGATPSGSPRLDRDSAARGPRFKPLQSGSGLDTRKQAHAVLSVEEENSRIRSAIHSIEDKDPSISVDALKELQRLLASTPNEIMAYSNDLIEAIALRLQVIFRNPSTISEEASFRLAKHLIQTLSNFCDNTHLVEGVSGNNLRLLIRQLSLGLLMTDNADGSLKDMSRFMNMSILRLFATGQRIAIYDALFKLLQSLALELTEGDSENDLKAKHAELILKCIWKRSRTTKEDIIKGVINEEDIFTILEEFLQVISPKEWRLRAARKVPLGDMPLRTVKVLIQHAVEAIGRDGVMDCLHGIYGELMQQTFVYEYAYRLSGTDDEQSRGKPSTSSQDLQPTASASVGSLATSAEDRTSSAEVKRTDAATKSSAAMQSEEQLIIDEVDKELKTLIQQSMQPGGGSQAGKAIAVLLQANPGKQTKFGILLNTVVGASNYKLFVKRLVDQHLQVLDTTAVSTTSSTAPPRSPERPVVNKRQSIAPVIPVDADDDTKLAMLRDKMRFLAAGPEEDEAPDP